MQSSFRESYTRLSDGLGSPSERHSPGFSPPFRSEYEPRAGTGLLQSFRHFWRVNVLGAPEEVVQPSAYLTLIPLNDARLQPRRMTFILIMLGFLCVCLVTATFFLVPRGISAGAVSVTIKKSYWTGSNVDFSLVVRLPISNPNYFPARVSGHFEVDFYDAAAAKQKINETFVPPRALPHILQVEMDVVNLPDDYSSLMLTICTAAPRRLIFFLKGSLSVTLLGRRAQLLAPIDTYFLADCFAPG